MERDPNESRNLAYDPEYAPVLARMRKELDRLEDERKTVRKVAEFPHKFLQTRAAAIKKFKIPQEF